MKYLPVLLVLLAMPAAAQKFTRIIVPEMSELDYHCMYMNAYYEGKSEPIMFHQALVEVVFKRVQLRGYPSSVCAVIFDKGDFSWTSTDYRVTEQYAYDLVKVMVDAVIEGFRKDKLKPIVMGATHYHADYVTPCWLPDMRYITIFGQHKFYKQIARTGACLPSYKRVE